MAASRPRPGCVQRVTGQKAGFKKKLQGLQYNLADLMGRRIADLRAMNLFRHSEFYVHDKWIVGSNAKEMREFCALHGINQNPPDNHRVDYMTTVVEAVREARKKMRQTVPTPEFAVFLVKVEPIRGAHRSQHAILYITRFKQVDAANMEWWEQRPYLGNDPYNAVEMNRARRPPMRFGQNIHPAPPAALGMFCVTLVMVLMMLHFFYRNFRELRTEHAIHYHFDNFSRTETCPTAFHSQDGTLL